MHAWPILLASVSILIQPPEAVAANDAICAQIRSGNARSGALYAVSSNQVKMVKLGQRLSREFLDHLIYFTKSDAGNVGEPSVINVKSVFVTLAPPRRETVDVDNDQWNKLSNGKRNRVNSICRAVFLDGYEDFHLRNARNYCLSYFFHQKQPFNTLATRERRESFAFGEMVSERDRLAFLRRFGIASAQAAQAGKKNSPKSRTVSSIVNYNYDNTLGSCVTFKIDPPDGTSDLVLRVTNMGFGHVKPKFKDWNIKVID